MASDTEMSDSDSPVLNLDPAIAASVRPGPERAVYNHREYIRHPGIRAAQDPSVIWNLGEEYERKREVMGLPQDGEVDEFTKYNQDVTPVSNLNTFNLIKWWDDAKTDFPTLHLWAFDTLAIPAMSAECERVFSSAKKLITPERNRLHEQIIEASECLKNWWDRGLIQQQPNTPADSEDCELEDEDDCDI
jgi:hAT family C-terminal dimerisation region